MENSDDLQLRLATTLAPMLLTVATFALGAASFVTNPENTLVDELLSLLSSFCVFSSALLIDSALDKQSLNFVTRLTFLNGGYVCFCIVVGAMTTIIPILYEARRSGAGVFGWHKSFILFIAAGASVFLKMMTHKDRQGWTVSMFIFYVLSIYAIAK